MKEDGDFKITPLHRGRGADWHDPIGGGGMAPRMVPVNPDTQPAQDMPTYLLLRDYLEILNRKRKVGIIVFVAVLSVVVLYTFTRTPIFRSTCLMEFEDKKEAIADVAGEELGFLNFERYLKTQQETIKCRDLAKLLVERMDLAESPEFNPKPSWIAGIRSSITTSVRSILPWSANEPKVGSDDQARKDRLVDAILSRIGTKPVRKSRLLIVTMDAADPAMAKRMLENLIRIYLRQRLQQRRSQSLEDAAWLKEELAKIEEKLKQSERAFMNFMAKHAIVSDGANGSEQVLAVLEKTLDSLVRSKEATARYKALREKKTGNSVGVGTIVSEGKESGYLKKLREDLAELESKEIEMSGLYAETYPKRLMLRKKIAVIRKRIAEAEKVIASSAYETAARKEKILKEAVDGAKKDVLRVGSVGAEYALLKRNVDTNRELYKVVLSEYKRAQIRASRASNDVRVVARPTLPYAPVKPKKKLYLLAGFMLAIFMGVGASVLAHGTDITVQTTEELEREVGAPTLAIIPHAERLPRDQFTPQLGEKLEFVPYEKPGSALSDALNSLHVCLLYGSPHAKCISITSATPAEGKSFIACTLASVLTARGTNKVILVECDLRKPRLSSVFNIDAGAPGLTSVIDGEDNLDRILTPVSRIPGLEVVTSGSIPADPIQPLLSGRLGWFIQHLRDRADYVILDCPPLLGFPDANLVSRVVDGYLLVARQGAVTVQELRAGVISISRTQGRILGCVLNFAGTRGSGYSFGGYYYSGKYHRYQKPS